MILVHMPDRKSILAETNLGLSELIVLPVFMVQLMLPGASCIFYVI